jgi:hypothetical protein|tara:strand:+ start:468 stop:704 length:237 start_codon:yes stop_codon:yes gene_type:complete
MKEVKIKVGDELLDGLLNNNELILSNDIEVGDSINIDGKDHKVVSAIVDNRDNIIKINLANASKPKKEKKSDDKQTKG